MARRRTTAQLSALLRLRICNETAGAEPVFLATGTFAPRPLTGFQQTRRVNLPVGMGSAGPRDSAPSKHGPHSRSRQKRWDQHPNTSSATSVVPHRVPAAPRSNIQTRGSYST
jgi:hypothetical protein